MEALQHPTGLADGDIALLLPDQPRALLLYQDVGGQRQGPETDDGSGGHELILIQAEHVFRVAKKDLHVPAGGGVAEQRGRVGVQVARGPIACRRGRRVEGRAGDDEVAAVEFAHARLDDRDVDLAGLLRVVVRPGPVQQRKIVRRQDGRCVRVRYRVQFDGARTALYGRAGRSWAARTSHYMGWADDTGPRNAHAGYVGDDVAWARLGLVPATRPARGLAAAAEMAIRCARESSVAPPARQRAVPLSLVDVRCDLRARTHPPHQPFCRAAPKLVVGLGLSCSAIVTGPLPRLDCWPLSSRCRYLLMKGTIIA